MKNIIKTTALAALLAVVLAPVPRALADGSTDDAKASRAMIDATRSQSAKVRNQIGLTLEALNRMPVAAVDLREQYTKYTTQLATMQGLADSLRETANSMGDKNKAFFAAWKQQINSIANEDIRKQAQDRYDKRAESYAEITKKLTEARDQLGPFLSNLTDLKTLFDSELTRGSVTSAKSLIKDANSHGEDVVDSLKDMEKELDRVSAELAKYQ